MLPYDVLIDIFDSFPPPFVGPPDQDAERVFRANRDACLLWRTAAQDSYRYQVRGLFVEDVCKEGCLTKLRWIRTNSECRETWRLLFHMCCQQGYTAGAKWMLRSLLPSVPTPWVRDGFCVACQLGHLEIAKFLKDAVFLDRETTGRRALRSACQEGHVGVARWLKDAFDLTGDDARDQKARALALACSNGRLEALRWLKEAFGLTDDDARSGNNRALAFACDKGHLDIVRCLRDEFGLTTEDARSRDNVCLRLACQGNHMEVARFLRDDFGVTARDAHMAFYLACEQDFLETAKRLADLFRLTEDIVRQGHALADWNEQRSLREALQEMQ